MMNKKTNKIIIQVAVNIFKEGNRYIADCPALQLATHGATINEAQKNFSKAINLWLKTTIENNTLKKALLELGWKIKPKEHYIVPQEISYNNKISLIKQKYYLLSISVPAN